MSSVSNVIEQLVTFQNREKFSDKAWKERGLNPSNIELCLRMTSLFDNCANALIEASQQHAPDKRLKKILKQHLSYFRASDYDTEEREFIAELFNELAGILNVKFSGQLDRWLYGWFLHTMFKVFSKRHSDQIMETIKQSCSDCGNSIDTFILEKEERIPDSIWNIIQCKNCGSYSLVSYGPGVKRLQYGNYIPVEQLPKSEFTKEQAEIRLEQIRYFRKQ